MVWLGWLWMGCTQCSPPPVPVPVPTEGEAVEGAPRAQQPVPFELVKPALRDPKWAEARCNDGTPFSMDIRDQGASVWVVQITGGYFCDDDQTACADRARRLTTTAPEEDGRTRTLPGQGLFSRKVEVNPDFHDANHVKMHYCSSDLWLGRSTERQATTGSEEGWFFSGHHNLKAGFGYLREHGMSADHEVLVVGYSAGGAGVVGNFDAMLGWMAPQREAGALKFILDGSWIPPWDPDGMPRADRWGDPHPTCARRVREQGGDVATCVFGPSWWPDVAATKVPVLVQISGLDATQTPAFGVVSSEDLEHWRAGARASFAPVPWVFSGGRRYHVLSFHDRFAHFGPPDERYRELVGSFWRGEEPTQVVFGYDRPISNEDTPRKRAPRR